MSRSPAVILYDASGNALAIQDGVAIPASTPGLLVLGSDGGTARRLAINASGLAGIQNPPNLDVALSTRATETTLASADTKLAGGLPAALVGGRLDANTGAWLGSTAPSVGQKVMAASLPVTMASDQPAQVFTLGNPDGDFLTLSYDSTVTIAGAQAELWLRASTYTVPAGKKFTIGQYNAFAEDNRCTMRVAEVKQLGTWNPNTDVYTNITSYTLPIFGAFIELEVTSAMGNVDDQEITIDYTNSDGTSGRTATAVADIKLKKQTPAGYKMLFSLQSPDIGVLSVQDVTADMTNTGSVAVNGGIDLFYQRAMDPNTNYILVPSAAAPVVAAGKTLSLDISSNAGATERRMLKCIGVLEDL